MRPAAAEHRDRRRRGERRGSPDGPNELAGAGGLIRLWRCHTCRRGGFSVARALDRPPSLPVAATSLADVQFDTGRPEVPESTIGGQTTCINLLQQP